MEDTLNYKQLLVDGVKIFINDLDTVLCIPDKVNNIVHLNVESDNENKSEKLLNNYRKKIQEYLK